MATVFGECESDPINERPLAGLVNRGSPSPCRPTETRDHQSDAQSRTREGIRPNINATYTTQEQIVIPWCAWNNDCRRDSPEHGESGQQKAEREAEEMKAEGKIFSNKYLGDR